MLFWFGSICGGLVLLLVLYLLGTATYEVVRFQRTPEARWRRRVYKIFRRALRQAEDERTRMRAAGLADADTEQALYTEYFRRFLEQISVEELDAYPGIGPVTIARLREAGCATLANLLDRPAIVEGLGQKRWSDIQRAVDELVRQAQGRFDAGACREAQEFVERRVAVRAGRSEEGGRALERFQATQAILHQLEPFMEEAAKITYLAHVHRPRNVSFSIPAIMHRRLPDLDEALRNADEEARRQYAEVHMKRTPAVPSSVSSAARPARESPVDLFRHALDASPAGLPSAAPAAGHPTAAPEAFLSLVRMSVRLARAVARADGTNASTAPAIIDNYLRDRCGADRALFNRIRALCAQDENASLDPADCLEWIVRLHGNEERQRILDLVHAVALSAGKSGPRAQKLLDRIARRFGLAAAPAAPTPNEPTQAERLAVLEIDPAAPLSADLVRRQHRLLQERYAPEKFQVTGPDFVQLAQRKRAAAQQAAAALLQQWGEPLEPAPAAAESALRHNPDLDAVFGD